MRVIWISSVEGVGTLRRVGLWRFAAAEKKPFTHPGLLEADELRSPVKAYQIQSAFSKSPNAGNQVYFFVQGVYMKPRVFGRRAAIAIQSFVSLKSSAS